MLEDEQFRVSASRLFNTVGAYTAFWNVQENKTLFIPGVNLPEFDQEFIPFVFLPLICCGK